MVQINYTKESGIKQQSGSAGFTIPSDITIGHPFTDSPTGNTVSTLDLTGIKHSDTPAGADEISLDGKYITFRSANGDSFYVWFNPGDDAGSTDPLLSGIAIPVIAAPADLNTDAKIIDQIVLALNASAAFTKPVDPRTSRFPQFSKWVEKVAQRIPRQPTHQRISRGRLHHQAL